MWRVRGRQLGTLRTKFSCSGAELAAVVDVQLNSIGCHSLVGHQSDHFDKTTRKLV